MKHAQFCKQFKKDPSSNESYISQQAKAWNAYKSEHAGEFAKIESDPNSKTKKKAGRKGTGRKGKGRKGKGRKTIKNGKKIRGAKKVKSFLLNDCDLSDECKAEIRRVL